MSEYSSPRTLVVDDYETFLPLLRQLTKAPEVDRKSFARRVGLLSQREHRDHGDDVPRQFCIVVERKIDKCIVATASLTLEYKFIRGLGVCGHIEDVVVDQTTRGSGLGKIVVNECVAIAKECGCYKVILDCAETNIGFYETMGFQRKEVQMAMYL